MKTLILFVAITTLIGSSVQQACPQDPRVGNPINFVHLFKEQTDLNWDFYNTKTSNVLVFMDSTPVAATLTKVRIVFRVTDTNLPKRDWLYMIELRYDANDFISQIDRYGKVRSDTVVANDLLIAKAFFNDNTIVFAAAGNCCLDKLEYINFYYLFANYYKNGDGLTKPACT